MKTMLIKCGWLVSLDDGVGDIQAGELLIQGDRIAAAGRNLGATADETLDATGMIVMPGLVHAHIHTWQSGLRGIGGEWTSPDYHLNVHGNLSTRYGPEDNYLGNLVGALNQINGGVTTILDWCHNLTSLEMAERSVDGLEEAGIRAVFAHGTAKPPTPPGGVPYTHIPHPRDRVEALRKGRFASNDQLLTLGLALLGPQYSTWEVFEHDIRLAREFGLVSTSHATRRNADAITSEGYIRLAKAGLLGPDHNIVHANYLSDEELTTAVHSGASFSATVLTEMHGHAADPVTLRVRAAGGMPSLGIDIETVVTGEFWREMQAALLHGRFASHRINAAAGNKPFTTIPVRSREALQWATLGGARALMMEDKIGSLKPGKKADLVMLRMSDLNLVPVHDPVGSIVEQANAGNVDSVMIGGEFRKRGGELLYPEAQLSKRVAALAESAARIMRDGGFTVTRA